MRKSLICCAFVVGLVSSGSLSAQESNRPATRGRSAGGANSAMSMLQRQFDQRSPALGSELPDIAVYDGEGNPLRVRDLRGKFTVIVFGCLT